VVGDRLLNLLPDLLFVITSRDALVRLIMETGASTHTIWTKAANLFLDNKASRTMTLEAKFRALSQGGFTGAQVHEWQSYFANRCQFILGAIDANHKYHH
jgi:hypothetical protein